MFILVVIDLYVLSTCKTLRFENLNFTTVYLFTLQNVGVCKNNVSGFKNQLLPV